MQQRATSSHAGSFTLLILLGLRLDLVNTGSTCSGGSSDVVLGERKSAADLLEKCTGSPEERRAVAALGDEVTPEQWRSLAECMRRHHARLSAHFALHVSKSAGTSLCRMYVKSNCSVGVVQSNCNVPEMDSWPKWVRRSTVKRLGWSPGSAIVEEGFREKPLNCLGIRDTLRTLKRNVAKFERWLPHGAPCPGFMNAIVIRAPLQRLVSHYIHLHRWCLRGPNNQTCSQFFEGEGENGNIFNVSFTSKEFDIVTDNFYTRSLNPFEVYASPFGLSGEGEKYLGRALEALFRFDWIMTIGTDDPDEVEKNTLIQTDGMGMTGGMEHANLGTVRDARELPVTPESSLTPESRQWLHNLNQFDTVLWREARRLHALDVFALENIRRFSDSPGHASGDLPSGTASNCCGRVCP